MYRILLLLFSTSSIYLVRSSHHIGSASVRYKRRTFSNKYFCWRLIFQCTPYRRMVSIYQSVVIFFGIPLACRSLFSFSILNSDLQFNLSHACTASQRTHTRRHTFTAIPLYGLPSSLSSFCLLIDLNWIGMKKKNSVQNRSGNSGGGGGDGSTRSAYTLYRITHTRRCIPNQKIRYTIQLQCRTIEKCSDTKNPVVDVAYPLWINHNAYYFIISFTIDNNFFSFVQLFFLLYLQWRQSHGLRAI